MASKSVTRPGGSGSIRSRVSAGMAWKSSTPLARIRSNPARCSALKPLAPGGRESENPDLLLLRLGRHSISHRNDRVVTGRRACILAYAEHGRSEQCIRAPVGAPSAKAARSGLAPGGAGGSKSVRRSRLARVRSASANRLAEGSSSRPAAGRIVTSRTVCRGKSVFERAELANQMSNSSRQDVWSQVSAFPSIHAASNAVSLSRARLRTSNSWSITTTTSRSDASIDWSASARRTSREAGWAERARAPQPSGRAWRRLRLAAEARSRNAGSFRSNSLDG